MKLLLTAIATVAFCASALADEVDTPFKDLPPAVQKSMQKLVGEGKISKTVKETEDDGTVIYEVSYSVGNTLFEAEVSEAGKVIVTDEQISLEQAPAPVRTTIEDKTRDAKIIKIEKATEGSKIFYEVEYEKDSKELEVKIAPDGKVLQDKDEGAEGKGDNDDKKG